MCFVPQARKTCGGCKDPAAVQHKCDECNEGFHNSCLLYYHTYKEGNVPEGEDPLSGKTARCCGSCVKTFKNPLKLKPVVWHHYNKLVWQALKKARTTGTPYIPPCGRPALDHIVDDQTATTTDSQTATTTRATTDESQTATVTPATTDSQTVTATATPATIDSQTATPATTDSQQVQTETTESLPLQIATATTESQQPQTETETTDTEQVQTETESTDSQQVQIETESETFEIVVPATTTAGQRGVSLVRFFGKKPQWHGTLFVARGIVCQTRPRHALVPGSQFDIQSENAEKTKSFCVIFPGLWIGFASGSRQRTPRRKAPMRVVVIEEQYLDLPAPDTLLHLQVISCNRVKSVLLDKHTKLYPDVSTSMNARCLLLQNEIIGLTKDDINYWKQITPRNIRTFKEITASAVRRARAEKRRCKEKSARDKKRTEKRKLSATTGTPRTKKATPPPPALANLTSEKDTDHEVGVY